MQEKLTSEARVETNTSKIIRDQGSEKIEQWQPPAVSGRGKNGLDPNDLGALLTAGQLEGIQKRAFEEGFAQGKKEGFEYGHKEARAEGRKAMQASTQRIDALLSTLDTPFLELDEQVERELVTLVIGIVRQLVRREVRADPGQIIGVVREALAILPIASRNVRLILHPEDAELVREIYSLSETELGWCIVEDPVLARGGCKVITDTSQIDATLDSRLAALIAPLLGGERSGDAEDNEA